MSYDAESIDKLTAMYENQSPNAFIAFSMEGLLRTTSMPSVSTRLPTRSTAGSHLVTIAAVATRDTATRGNGTCASSVPSSS